MKKIIYLLLLALLVTPGITFCQEILTGLQSNPVIKNYLKSQHSVAHHDLKKNKAPLALPFIDDFSKPAVFPDNSKWIDNEAFINNTYPLFPISYGVATLDAIDSTGSLYAEASPFPFVADHLTSQFIDLHLLNPSDSVKLSFYVQPQGISNDPQVDDSLVLQFLVQYRADTVVDTTTIPPTVSYIDKWRNVWSMPGMTLDSFLYKNNNKYFKYVMIPVDSQMFFRSDFRFRFFNYASIASPNVPSWQSNCDQWNIDYVYLNSGRTMTDTAFDDLTFVSSAPSLLNSYQSMTSKQYCFNKPYWTKDSLTMLIANLGTITQGYNDTILIKDNNGTTIIPLGFYNLAPYSTFGYQTYSNHWHPQLGGYTFPVNPNDTGRVEITHFLSRPGASQDFIKQNDTVRFTQVFSDYLAYDDGTPEAGYGLSPSGSELAYKFTLSELDTIVGLSMFFNKTLNLANQKGFYLAIWKDKAGKPGDLFYMTKSTSLPIFADSMNIFENYYFNADSPLILDNTNLTFYVGWVQVSDDNLNVGFDLNNDSRNKIYYNVDGSWQESSFTGSLMIRPIFSSKFKKISPVGHISFGPNPSNGRFNFVLPGQFTTQDLINSDIAVYNVMGERITDLALSGLQVDLSTLSNGVYFIRIINKEKNITFTNKLVIAK